MINPDSQDNLAYVLYAFFGTFPTALLPSFMMSCLDTFMSNYCNNVIMAKINLVKALILLSGINDK